MRSKHRLGRIALCSLAVAAVLVLLLLLSGQSAATRQLRLDTTAAEIQRGNYFAWGQAWMWVDKMTPAEKSLMMKTCSQYARTNSVLNWQHEIWPPERNSPPFLQPLTDWMKRVLDVQDNRLDYDHLLYPPFPEIKAYKFNTMYEGPAREAR